MPLLRLASSPRAHDLVRVATTAALTSCPADAPRPGWVDAALGGPGGGWAVVRRSPADAGLVSVGVRGDTRDKRWPALVASSDIVELVRPQGVPRSPRPGRAGLRPFLGLKRAGAILDELFPDAWGVTGSLAFELVTGAETARNDSDIDITILAPQPLDRRAAADAAARVLSAAAVPVDLQVETPLGAVALDEWIREAGLHPVALRTIDGPRLVLNPWSLSCR
ncbi:malonate decarboxylase holo-ACP synthase [Cryobacterium zhongshanensis]|uniref:malonate decarboxylase holo-ACP synthase n=1 Tax=Cryobacterium zhongshanensis TaxID=2928153 RepID=UPI0027DED9E2|nr:malonate decarboxylase holo-ACP synthase [Cryobacterium zhongshanensis]